MRTPPGLSIRKLAWPRKVIDTVSSTSAAARRSGDPATTPVHAACAVAIDVIRNVQTKSSRVSRERPLSPGGGASAPSPCPLPRPAGGEDRRAGRLTQICGQDLSLNFPGQPCAGERGETRAPGG